jgi:hypothetical protein
MMQAETIKASEYVRSRAVSNPFRNRVYLPCGCAGLDWPIVQTLGSVVKEILCDTHGWQGFTGKLPPRPKEPRRKKGSFGDDVDTIPF